MCDILPELNGKDYIVDVNEKYDIHFCKMNEVDELVDFLDKYWRKDHIFTLSRKLLDFQHRDEACDRYNFVIAKNRVSGEIHSILGFVPTYQFDKEIKDVEVWPCIWKSRDYIPVKGLGVSLYHYLKENIQIETISILGISEIALSIYKHWNFSTGKMEHFFLPNFAKKDFHILKGKFIPSTPERKDSMKLEEMGQTEFEKLDEMDLLNSMNRYKSKKYYINRFFKHPMYEYRFLAIKEEDSTKLVLTARVCTVNEFSCLRIVDCIGDISVLKNVTHALQKYMENEDLEYIDFIEVGLDEESLIHAGFINRKQTDAIVPNYFEPFLQENIDLDYAYKTVLEEKNAIFFKADADQDRPNMITNGTL